MTDHPILFSAAMVRALLAGTKTQTRRIMKPQLEPCDSGNTHCPTWKGHAPDGWWCSTCGNGVWMRDWKGVRCPYGAPGDRLWVREGWAPRDGGYAYMADHPGDPRGLGWRPSIHMPRAACRLTWEVTEVRVQRLQDISEADAEAEGVQEPSLVPLIGAFWSSRDGYALLWEQINGKGSWAANPWVWAVTFRRAP